MTAVFFDLDDTLYRTSQPFFAAWKALFPPLLETEGQLLYKSFRRHSNHLYDQLDKGKITLKEQYVGRIQKAVEEVLQQPLHEEKASAFQKQYAKAQGHIQLDPEMKRVLDRLQEEKIPMGVVTNGPTAVQQKKVDGLGLSRWFLPGTVIISGTLGISKPDKRIFCQAADQLAIAPGSRVLFVGDAPENDIKGADQMGWETLWLDWGVDFPPPFFAPTYVADRFDLAAKYILHWVKNAK